MKALLFFAVFTFSGLAFYFYQTKTPQESVRIPASMEEASTPYSFGGTCSSQGSWTASALSQTNNIKNILIALKDDPNCRGIESIVGQVSTVQSSFSNENKELDTNIATWEGLPADINALRELSQSSNSNTSTVMKMLMGKTLNNVILSSHQSIAIRADRVARTGLSFVNQTLNVLPQLDQCLVNKPNQALALVGGLLKLTSAFASSGENVVSDLGNTIANLSTYLRNSKFTKTLSKLDETQLWMSMSCLVETTTESYCAVRDNYQMLDYADKAEKLKKNLDNDNNPLEGYFLLTREVPIIASWLQKVQFGATPKFTSDTIPKNSTIMSFATFQTKQNILLAKYAQSAQMVGEEPDMNKKKILVREMILDLASTMNGGGGAFGGNSDEVNFYTKAKSADLIPFFLMGRNEIPQECLGRMAMSVDDYLKGNGIPNQPEFADPTSLVSKIGEQLKLISDEAALIAGRYYQNRVIIDTANLVDDSVTSQTISVYQSMGRISNYLGKLIEKSTRTRKNTIQLPSMIETKRRIDDVIASYSKIKSKVNEYLEMKKDISSKEDMEEFQRLVGEDAELKTLTAKIVQTAFEKFNVAVQKDTFLYTRLSTYVQKDYATRIKDTKEMDAEQQKMLITAGASLIDRLNSVYKKDPNSVKMDLTTAQVVNKRNIDAIEETFAQNFSEAIRKVGEVAKTGAVPANVSIQSRSKAGQAIDNFMNMIRYNLLLSSESTGRKNYSMSARLNTVKQQEDANGSFAAFKARLCIQALAFSDQGRFKDLCKGTMLVPVITIDEKTERDRNMTYNDLTIKYDDFQSGPRVQLTNYGKVAMRDAAICAFRNYRRSNYAYWMVKEFSGQIKSYNDDY